jgi:hypothetical protein
MSWLYSQALVAASLEANSLDGEQYAPLKSNPIPQAYLSKDRMTAFSRLSRFGMTFAPLTENLGAELLTLYLEAFPARISVQQDEAQGLQENEVDCGKSLPVSLAKYDHDTALWRTHQCSLLGDLEPFSETWPRWGMMRDGECWAQSTPERHTSGSESGSWPTPDANMGNRGTQPEWLPIRTSGQPAQYTINQAVRDRTWATPTRRDYKDCWNSDRGIGSQDDTHLPIQVFRQEKMFPTPTKHNAQENGAPSQMDRSTVQLGDLVGGQLNPTWVEWLMGWPLEWTDLKPLAMDKFQQWLHSHGIS